MSRPAESPGGFRNTEPALAPPGWCSRRQRTISAMRALARLGGRRRRPRTRRRSRSRRRRAPSGGTRSRGRTASRGHLVARTGQVDGRAPARAPRRSRGRGPRRSCGPRRRRCRGCRRRTRGPTARPRRCGGRARAAGPRRRPAPYPGPVGRRGRPRSNSPASTTATPVNPWSATSRFDPRPTRSSGGACSRTTRATAASASSDRARTSVETGPPRRYVVSGPAARRARPRRERALAVRPRPPRRCPPRSCRRAPTTRRAPS